MTDRARRRLLIAGLGMGLCTPFCSVARMLAPTPPQTAGPFYPPELPLDDDNDLTRVSGRASRAEGRITDLSGRVVTIPFEPGASNAAELAASFDIVLGATPLG